MPRMRWRPGLRLGPHWGSSTRSPRSPSRLGRGGGRHPSQEPHASRRLDPRRAFSVQRSLLGATFLAYTHLNFGNTALIASIVISLSRGCLPNDEGPGPQIFFPRTATVSVLTLPTTSTTTRLSATQVVQRPPF